MLITLKNRIVFSLSGSSEIKIMYNEEFIDPLFVATDGLGNDLSNYVTINGKVNSNAIGVYIITYTLDYKDYHEMLTRYVTVKSNNDFVMILNGDDTVNVLLGTSYHEDGAYVINNKTGERFENIEINSLINTNVVGEYSVNYSFTINDEFFQLQRKVIVFDIPYTISLSQSLASATINIDTSVIKRYFYTLLPNGKYVYDSNISYQVVLNDDYTFVLYDSNKVAYTKKINVNIIKNDLTCKGVINYDGTFLTINGSSTSNISKVNWNVDGVSIDGSVSLKKVSIINNASANILYNDGNSIDINCSIQDNLLYHFKYDEMNTKEFMSCNSYTLNDKILLEDKLQKSIMMVGYGTRAGVVEAARFIVGGLEYKIPYLGPKKN